MEDSANFTPLCPQKHGDFESPTRPLFYKNVEKVFHKRSKLNSYVWKQIAFILLMEILNNGIYNTTPKNKEILAGV